MSETGAPGIGMGPTLLASITQPCSIFSVVEAGQGENVGRPTGCILLLAVGVYDHQNRRIPH